MTSCRRFHALCLPILISTCFFLFSCSEGMNARRATVRNVDGVVFASPEDALTELKAAFASEDPERLVSIYGRIGKNIVVTGDRVADAVFMRKISARLNQRAELVSVFSAEYSDEQWFKVRFGEEAWNMRIPLVNRGKGWVFATEYAVEAAKETRRELNEVFAADTLFLLVAAQRQYFKTDNDGDGILEYAQRIISQPGKRDGLYWEESPGENQSPLDRVVAKAINAGYQTGANGGSYFGYKYRIVFGQARGTRGAVQSYLKNGNMTGGFAILAYPVNWGVSGEKAFIVDSIGRVYKKNLGFRTESIASKIDALRLDSTWVRVEHPELGLRL